jgi:thymidylate synthase
MKTYLDALRFVLENGEIRDDRTGVGTIGVFGMQQRYDLSKGFPAVTTKKLAFKSCLSELLWFIEGSDDERRLAEILHGTRDMSKKTIWTDNATAPYWLEKKPAKRRGLVMNVDTPADKTQYALNSEVADVATNDMTLGRVYGVQWRQWRVPYDYVSYTTVKNTEHGLIEVPNTEHLIDQLAELVEGIKTDPYSRRHILTAWNPGELDQMALPPCHCFAQFYVSKDNKLSCQMYQRSCDMFLGVPFNIASYSILTHMIAQVTGLKVGEFVHVLGDAHIYTDHVEQVKEQLEREPLPAPTLWVNPDIKDINDFKTEDFRLDGYQAHPPIKAPMAV